jgi:2-oxoglutarate dehydrogenase E1 component
MTNPTFANRWNADLIDENYQRWQSQPESVDSEWRAFFEGFALANEGRNGDLDNTTALSTDAQAFARKQSRFTGAIYGYRAIGHTQARFNPLIENPPKNPRLDLLRLGFSEQELDQKFDTGNYCGSSQMSVRELIERLNRTYCGSIGVEYLHIQETSKRRFLQAMMEPTQNQPDFSKAQKIQALDKIIQAESFEKFLHTRYVGQKRFGLEGGESLIASLDAVLEFGPDMGVEEIVIGMAHRGRLNVLANILGKSYEYIFNEFSENYIPQTMHGDGDVKYHLGFDAIVKNSRRQSLILQLAANPSHLEAVNPVVEGRVRARQRILGDTEKRRKVLPLLIHGDAAFAGQGVIAELLNFSQLKGYTTGGTLHIVINNQIGFTTNPSEARSTLYCTDIAKMIEAPIFHVNGDDPVAVLWATKMALAYRTEFGADVVIDMYCYRRHGHNEVDEPVFTQPSLYRKIKDHPLISETYAKQLRSEQILTEQEETALRKKHQLNLDDAFERGNKPKPHPTSNLAGSTAIYQPDYNFIDVATRVESTAFNLVAETLTHVPNGFHLNPKIQRLLEARKQAWEQGQGIDWAFAEQLSWGTLMLEDTPVRLSGQDCERGTFSHRHAVWVDMETQERYMPLRHIPQKSAQICVHNSLLSEAAVLGFDFGYSLDYPQMLCMWEAQFGDFANGAQVIFDQFIASSESKWQRISGLVMLLPHGYEGQGPEHSSARPERYLQSCAQNNIQVCNLTTPAQYFHVLRRQMRRAFRKPLIIMSPKSLLRHKDCISSVSEFTEGGFQCILDDPQPPKKAKRVILCSGKIYYELVAYREAKGIKNTAIVRIEQLYPLHSEQLKTILDQYTSAETFVWCQEESKNMGAWFYIWPLIEEIISKRPVYVGRDASASPAVGSLALHKKRQSELIETAFIG